MRYTITEMSDYSSWPMLSTTVISEPGSKEIVLRHARMDHFGSGITVIGEDADGVKLVSNKPPSQTRTQTNYFIVIPETHPMYNINILRKPFHKDEAHSYTILTSISFMRKQLQDLYYSLIGKFLNKKVIQ